MITGVHIGIVNSDIKEVNEFLRDKLGLPNYDAGGGFLIFDLPEVELAVESSSDSPFTLAFFCDDLEATVAELEGRGVTCAKPFREEAWGRVSEIQAPKGLAVLLYERKYSKGNPVG